MSSDDSESGGTGGGLMGMVGKNHLVGSDLTHPTAQGSEIVGRLIYEALYDGYTKYKARAGQQLVARGK